MSLEPTIRISDGALEGGIVYIVLLLLLLAIWARRQE